MSPSTSERQRKFMGAELARKRAGKKTKTEMDESQLEDFASKPLAKSGTILTSQGPFKSHMPDKEYKKWAQSIDKREGVNRPKGYKYKVPIERKIISKQIDDFIDKSLTKYPKWNERRKVTEAQLDKWAEAPMKITDERRDLPKGMIIYRQKSLSKKIDNLCKSIEKCGNGKIIRSKK